MKQFFLKLFTWWNSQTFGTQLWTWRFGELVGTDEYGNRYYRTKGGNIDPTLGFERRWVDYNGTAEASTIAAGLARLAASHRRPAADRGEGRPPPVVEAASPQSHRHPGSPPPDRLDTGAEPPAEGDGRLQALGPRPLRSQALAGRARLPASAPSPYCALSMPQSPC